MGQPVKNSFNLRLLLLIGVLLSGVVLIREYNNSLFFKEKDRITVGVYGEHPFVYSYHPGKKLAFVVYFDPGYELNLPGGYGWYKLGSLDLLGKIERKRPQLLKNAFGELAGSPVDHIIYPQKVKLVEPLTGDFETYFRESRGRLFSRENLNSISNLMDRIFLRRIFQVREDRLVFINTDDLYRETKGELRYDAQLLDSRLKGLFYRDRFLTAGVKSIVITSSQNYQAASRLLRQVEGMGIKVIEIEVNEGSVKERCEVRSNETQRFVARAVAKKFECSVNSVDSDIIRLVVGDKLGKEFSYN